MHLYYIGGYILAFQYFIHKSEVQILKQIDDNKIDATKLFEIKIPIHQPYISDWSEYEQAQGQIQLHGTYYRYVKLKMSSDTVSFICIPNTVKTRLSKANVVITKDISDIPVNKKGHDSAAKKGNPGNEYSYQIAHYQYIQFGNLFQTQFRPITALLIEPFIESPGKPPDTNS